MSAVKVEINSTELQEILGRAVQTLTNPKLLFMEIGEELLAIHRVRFLRQQSPDGTPWQPLADWYQASKAKNRDKILTLDGHLGGKLRYQATGQGVEFGSDRPYAAIHQFGGTIRPHKAKALNVRNRLAKSVTMPARPWLGLSDEDQQRIIEIAKSHLTNAFNA